MRYYYSFIVICCLVLTCINASVKDNEVDDCKLSPNVKQEIAGYQGIVDKIIAEVINGRSANSTYTELSKFIDQFGSRIIGSKNLENAIDYMLELSKVHGLSAHGETVNVDAWKRGYESAEMITPHRQNVPLLGLGSSVATPQEGITAEIVAVRSFDELDQIHDRVKNKIVVFNQKYVDYGTSAVYRRDAATKAAQYGAVATLVRSITPFSLRTPHTGFQDYAGNYKIPTACISVEDAKMFYRRYKHNETVTVKLIMLDKDLPNRVSRNTVVDIPGRDKKTTTVIVSAHLDSWDVGDGAMDDGAGAFLSWNSLAILKRMNLIPRRTLRAVLWTAEEVGLVGAFQYAKEHKDDDINFIMESDEGTFTPLGLEFAGNHDSYCIVKEIMKLFTAINTTNVKRSEAVGSDIAVFRDRKIPMASLLNQNERYFWYHHTEADTLSVENPRDLDLCTALWAGASYIIADLSFDMPRDKTEV